MCGNWSKNVYNFMSTQIFVKIENQKQNIISNLFQDLNVNKKIIYKFLKDGFEY